MTRNNYKVYIGYNQVQLWLYDVVSAFEAALILSLLKSLNTYPYGKKLIYLIKT